MSFTNTGDYAQASKSKSSLAHSSHESKHYFYLNIGKGLPRYHILQETIK